MRVMEWLWAALAAWCGEVLLELRRMLEEASAVLLPAIAVAAYIALVVVLGPGLEANGQ